MWSHQTSLKIVVQRKLSFVPPYCPNTKCKWHALDRKEKGVFAKYGSRPISQFPYFTQRYRCRNCRKVFSSSIFSISYRDRTKNTYEEIFDLFIGGYSRRQTAEFLGCSLNTVLRRVSKMAEQGLLKQAYFARNLKITESIAYDGLENFSFSQYDPNNINHAVGRDSLFVYDFNFAPLNRKGRMTATQRARKQELEREFGAYPRNAIHSSTKRIFKRLLERSDEELVLHSDRHYAYREVLERMPGKSRIRHIMTPSTVARNYRNRLFAVNHLDLLTRHHLSAFKRETIAFSKHSISMIEAFALFMVAKNFMRTMFRKKHVRDPGTNRESPAMRLGLTKKVLKFQDFFRLRLMRTQVGLNEDWQEFIRRTDPTSRRKINQFRAA